MKAFKNPLNGIAHYLHCSAEALYDLEAAAEALPMNVDDFKSFMCDQIANLRESEPGAYEEEWMLEVQAEADELANIWEKMIRP